MYQGPVDALPFLWTYSFFFFFEHIMDLLNSE
jgi:hypothetical protein